MNAIKRFVVNLPHAPMRWSARWRILRNHGRELNKRVEVETTLLAVAKGKRGPLTADECRVLSYKLGVGQ